MDDDIRLERLHLQRFWGLEWVISASLFGRIFDGWMMILGRCDLHLRGNGVFATINER